MDPANWKVVRIPTVGMPGQIDMMVSTNRYHPIANANDESSGVFVSYYDNVWKIASCRGNPDPQFYSAWNCAEKDTVGVARGWVTTSVAPSITPPVASTLRVAHVRIGGANTADLVASFVEGRRIVLAVCPEGAACSKASSWRLVTTQSRFAIDAIGSAGFLASDSTGDLFVAYPSFNGSSRSLNILAEGRFHGP
jgi:hypothetical protein